MRILHLTDLHFSENKSREIVNFVESQLVDKIITSNDAQKIDLIFFTGDLVFSGKNEDFENAKIKFIKPICDCINLPYENFILCAGNHDLEYGKELPAITQYIEEFKTNEEIDTFVKEKDEQYTISCYNINNFNTFIQSFYSSASNFIFHDLYQIHKFTIDNKSLGVVTFNSAWRSKLKTPDNKDKKDIDRIILPKEIILQAYNEIKDCDLHIALMHHELSDCKDYNYYEIEDIIYEYFHLKFSGHYHKKRYGSHYSTEVGMLSICSPSTMSGNDGSKIGFSILDFDSITYEGEIAHYLYLKADNIIFNQDSLPINIPVNKKKKDDIELYKAIKNAFEKELSEANDLLVFEEDSNFKNNFLDLFSPPLIKSTSTTQTVEKSRKMESINLNNLYDNNFIIYGKDKSGKTSLLRKIELDILKNYLHKNLIPFYVDFKNINSLNINKLLKNLLGLSNTKIKQIAKEKTYLLLIDNFNPDKENSYELYKMLSESLKVSSFVITCEETFTSTIEKIELNVAFKKTFLHSITRTEIREHTSKCLIGIKKSEQQEIINKIEIIFKQLNIPFDYWSLSLFLWLYRKEKRINIHDNNELVNLYIDELLERKMLAFSASNINYDSFKSFLGNLAYTLLTDYKKHNYTMTYGELVRFVNSYKIKNIRFDAEDEDLLGFLIERRIIKKLPDTHRYTFRLNGVMEYFIAVNMNENPKFVETIINDDYFFLEFANEFEIYAGFIKNDIEFLKKIRKHVRTALDELNKKYSSMNPDDIIVTKIKSPEKLIEITSSINPEDQKPMEYSEQDEMMDDMVPLNNFDERVRVKTPVQSTENYTHTELEKHLFILCRVFRSLSLIQNKDEIENTIDFILESVINLGFNLLEEIEFDSSDEEDEKKEYVLSLLSSFIPLIVQMNFSEAIIHKTLVRLIKEKIVTLRSQEKSNEFKLFILYFFLLDVDLENHISILDEIQSTFKLFPFKNATLFKFAYLLMFKSNGDKEIETTLKRAFIKQQLLINPKFDKKILSQNIDKKLKLTKNTK